MEMKKGLTKKFKRILGIKYLRFDSNDFMRQNWDPAAVILEKIINDKTLSNKQENYVFEDAENLNHMEKLKRLHEAMKDVTYENTGMNKLKIKIKNAISPETNIEKGRDSRWCNESTRGKAIEELQKRSYQIIPRSQPATP